MGEMTKNQKKEALRAWRQKDKKSYCLEQEEVEELFEYLEEALQAEECDHSLKNTDRKSTRLNSSHIPLSRMPSSA